jgi:hypothetical protein
MGLIATLKQWVVGEVVTANDLNGNFTKITAQVDGNLDYNNLKDGGVTDIKLNLAGSGDHDHSGVAGKG